MTSSLQFKLLATFKKQRVYSSTRRWILEVMALTPVRSESEDVGSNDPSIGTGIRSMQKQMEHPSGDATPTGEYL